MSSITEGKARIFQASASGWKSGYGDSPRDAAERFFSTNPRARKCVVFEGFDDGQVFSVIFGSHTYPGETVKRWPRSWKDITRKTLATVPALAIEQTAVQVAEQAAPYTIVMYGQTQPELDAKYPRTPLEITHDQWWELLECMYPEAWVRRGPNETFHLSELAYGDIALHAVKVGERYFRFHMHEHTTHDELVRHALGSPQ